MSDTTIPTLWQRLYFTRLRDAVRGRFDASLDWRRELDAVDLPDEIKQVVHDTVRATRLWNRERRDVTRELVAHFQDGLEWGRPAPILVATFGDVKSTAALIRRAKKRGRSLAWHAWRYGWWTVGALIVAYLSYALILLSGRPNIRTDYLAFINAQAVSVPESERAWPLYRRALGEMLVNREFPKWSDDPELAVGDSAWPEAVAWLDLYQPQLQLVREAARYKELGFTVGGSNASFSREDRQVLLETSLSDKDSTPVAQEELGDRLIASTRLPHLTTLRSIVRLMTIDSRRAASVGDGKTALADVAALLGISRHCEETPFLVNTRVAVVIQNLAYGAIQEVLCEHPQLWTQTQLTDLAHMVAATEVDWRRGFEGERASFNDILQRAYTDDGSGDGRPVLDGAEVFRLLENWEELPNRSTKYDWTQNEGLVALAGPATTLVMASRKEMAAAYEQYLQKSEQRFNRPLWDPEFEPEAELHTLLKGSRLGEMRYWIVARMAPALEPVRLRIAALEGQRDGILIGIALELYHREHGTWPTSLEELAPRWLPAVPVDRISGGPLAYKIVADRPLVYSLGKDGGDDGGRPPSELPEYAETYPVGPPHPKALKGDWVIWSIVPPESAPKWEGEEMGAGSE